MTKPHVELVKLQEWVKHKELKICVVFEGRDGTGKGGMIKAVTERVRPRVFRVVALPSPTERKKSQMYAQRYIPHFPAAGEVAIFDRSWYDRAGVERMMGVCTEDQTKRFLQVVPQFEKMMIESGIILVLGIRSCQLADSPGFFFHPSPRAGLMPGWYFDLVLQTRRQLAANDNPPVRQFDLFAKLTVFPSCRDERGRVSAGASAQGIEIYQFTDRGLELAATVAGTKYWQDEELDAGRGF